MKQIGKIIATERVPTTVDEFFFWTDKELIIKPFDVIKVNHIKNSITFGVVEEISHLTDNSNFLAGYISSDFGDVNYQQYTQRIGMNYVSAKVVGNSLGIYTPVLDGSSVSLATEDDVKEALGLKDIKNPLASGYIEMYEEPDRITIPVHFNSQFLIGPEGAHLNISGISGLASKTSYAMFLLKAIQDQYLGKNSGESIAYVLLNVKGRDLLAIDEPNEELTEQDKNIYKMLNLSTTPFQNVKYFYPYSKDIISSTYGRDVKSQMELDKAKLYKYIFEDDKESIDLLFSNVDDPNQTMESIVNYLATGQGGFNGITNWNELLNEVHEHTKAGATGKDKEITVLSWRKFYRLFRKTIEKTTIFSNSLSSKPNDNETRLKDSILNIKKNDVYVIDVAKLDEETQGFVFGDVMRSIYELKLGQAYDRSEADIPSKIVIFIDELNKYASKEVPKSSPILRQLLDITERGRSLGIILFSAEQFKSDIHDRVKGNCATHAYGRTNAIEVSKPDYQYVPPVYKSMLTRLKQGEYVVQNPVFRSLLNIKFPRPIYKQFKNG
ncbi:ATP-binding protein [Polaribacter sp.]|uniref:ATP-binding protein n=1 Tax=Polaribacter sp. TaxID=1920175 RepID=UPI0040486A54